MTKTLGIIGTGNIGRALARHGLQAGYTVVRSNSRGPDSLRGEGVAFGATWYVTSAGGGRIDEDGRDGRY